MIEVIITIVIIIVLTLLARINKTWKYLLAFCVFFYAAFTVYIALVFNDVVNNYDFNNAVKYLKLKEYTKAFDELQPLAKQGHASSQKILGQLYRDGLGVEKNDEEAFKWNQKAANQGSTGGLHHLGNSYRWGRGVNKNNTLAMQAYKKAADNGSPYAMDSIGRMYEQGEGVDKDYKKSAEWYKRAYEIDDLYKKFIGLWDSLKMILLIDDYRDISDKYRVLSLASLRLI